MSSLFAIFGLGPMEIAVIVVIGILLFGRKLPDMGRYLGKSITEFRKGMKGLEDDLDHPGAGGTAPTATGTPDAIRPPQRVAATAPKFEDAPAVPPQV
ncbi:MAG: twin-arginine translocase TatA/TatE family subunit [Gemmataceae bacterium]|nr:twin-arginine translocase TatA/TatE family subunit [Gemmataceae bacterium]